MRKVCINMTATRAELLEEMIVHGPRSYEHVHWSWKQDLNVLRAFGMVAYRGGLWRITQRGRDFYAQRTGKNLESLDMWGRLYGGKL